MPAEVSDLTLQTKDEEDSIIKTVPLMKPAVFALYSQAVEQHQSNELNKAIISLKRAHEIQPNAPQVMMLIAEITLQQGDFTEAFYWSRAASENSPSLGPICEKIWQTLALSAEMLGEAPVQNNALEQKQNCLVRPQNRY